MKKVRLLFLFMIMAILAGCGNTSKGKNESALKDGEYMVSVVLEGGSGRASISSPTKVNVKDGKAIAEIIWSSPNYDYMLVDGEKYLPVNGEGNSVFEIPVDDLNSDISVIADTTAMSTPHEIEYILKFSNEDKNTNITESESQNFVSLPSDFMSRFTNVELEFAKCFQIYRDSEGSSLIQINDGRNYLIIPEGMEEPNGIPDRCEVIPKSLSNIYLAASAVTALFDSIDGIDHIRFSGTNEKSLYVEKAKKSMQDGNILFAGKYSEPDYELLLAEECRLAIESTMILHSPEVLEKLESLGIPVLIDRSSYEPDPLGRLEWIKVYGELLGKEDIANSYFNEQKQMALNYEKTDKSVAFFYINDSGMIVTRKSSDYMAKMIQKAGGNYIFDKLGDEENAASGVTMSMEEFYASAKDADYIIYNATIENPLDSIDNLIQKSPLFKDFKAVENGNVWCTDKYLYQATNQIGTMISDLHTMLVDQDTKELSFMKKIQ